MSCRCIGLLVLLLTVHVCFAQRESTLWYFGNNAGLDFSTGTPQAIAGSKLNTTEGCASIADKNGQLAFYTDGITIWNRNHKVMTNGTGLMGDPSSTQSGIIVPTPGSRSQYYVFTVDNVAQPNGFRYSIVDLALENGLGKVTQKNELLLTPVTEKLTAVAHENGKDIWVLVHGWNNNAFYAYLLTEKGITAQPVISYAGTIHQGRDNNTIGYFKASPSGSKLALAVRGMKLYELFDFDDATGRVSNPVVFQSNNYNSAYGLEFSPDGTKLYVNASFAPTAKIYQIDLVTHAITLIGTSASSYAGAMQLGPDGKIYFSRYESSYLGVINTPNAAGTACGYTDDGIYLAGRTGAFGLPNFIQSLFHQPSFTFSNTCLTEPTYFAISDTNNIAKVEWVFNDPVVGVVNISSSKNPSHIFSQAGGYKVSLDVTYKDGSVKNTTQQVSIYDLPSVNVGHDTTLCTGELFELNAAFPGATYLWQDGSTKATYAVNKPGIYWVDVVTGGCPVRDSIIITYQTPASAELQDQDTTLCQGNSLLLTVKQPSSAATYTWQDGSAGTSFMVNKAGYYWVEVSNACGKSRDSIRIDYKEELPQFSLGNNRTIKPGDSLLLQISIPQVTYRWQDGSTNSFYGVTKPGIYWVEVSNGCEHKRDSVEIAYGLPHVKKEIIDTTICQGSMLPLYASDLLPEQVFQWQDGSTNAMFNVQKPGTYWIEISGKTGITKRVFTVTYQYAPQVELGENTTLCGDEQLVLNVRQASGKAKYVWQDGSTEATYTVQKPGIYWVDVTNSCGTVRDSITITCPECKLDELPNVITPNNDGANDSFTFACMNKHVWQLAIYNRWGKVVYTSQHYQGEWDASNLENGMYYYSLYNQSASVPYKGVIHVLR
ncbi:gliding motility-associated C-terminal domain-containing protein [Rhodocytophaga aerolata]|uniref:Gliding motility-associated C-terminal domain-containing protein n=1 Tax=Rhodocytophaga aerolata TaxID=455078 RepID=A0ABT8R556_9BACT|nr:gliding motility-associated C-terminal domain-containing protein [Rhodocytophaga aerolata]MDO1447230.1 gliding motility-associated C-terminal domain-containing protein [Rhodocytophaga aerolata]